jgi:ribosomal protein S18 acetylase RimI-like enzyme
VSEPASIRSAAPADLAGLTELLEAQFADHGIDAGGSRLADAVRGMLRDPAVGRILVAEAAGRLAGVAVISFIWALEHGGRSAWLDELYVRPQLRGRGIGRALLLRAVEEARSGGCAALDLEVERSHRRAERLYRRQGFRRRSRSRWVLPL